MSRRETVAAREERPPTGEPVALTPRVRDSLAAELRRLLAYWEERRGDRPLPARRHIDPLEFGYLLGRVSLVEVRPEPPRFRYRLVSTGLTAHLGYEMTGRTTAEIPEPSMRAYVEAHYTAAALIAGPSVDLQPRILDGRVWRQQALYLPLGEDGTTVDMLLVGRITDQPAPLVAPAPTRGRA